MKKIIDYPNGATPLDPNELEGLKFPHITTHEQLNQVEQANLETGMKWLQRKKNPDILNEKFIRDLHKKLFGDVWTWAGTFRKTGKNVGVPSFQIAEKIKILLDDVSFWIHNQTYAPIEIAIRFHHQLVFIHPFSNGNGRHARIMADAVLEKILKQKPIDWTKGYNLQAMNERRQQYIAALHSADSGDYQQLLQFVGE